MATLDDLQRQVDQLRDQLKRLEGSIEIPNPAWFDVKVYGAKGDNSNDDTTAITSAITAASAAGGGVVWFPAGTYKVTTSLAMKNEVTLQGAGIYATTLAFSGTGYLLDYTYSASGSTIWGVCHLAATVNATGTGAILNGHSTAHFIEVDLHDCRFDGPGESNAGTVGIYLGAVAMSNIYNVSVWSFEKCWKLELSTANVFTRLRAFKFRYGFEWTGSQNAQDQAFFLDVLGPTIGNDGYGVKIDSGFVHLHQPFFEAGTPEGYVNPTTIKAHLWITANGADFRSYGGSIASPGAGTLAGLTITNIILIDASAQYVLIDGLAGGDPASGTIAPISVGTPGSSHPALFCNCTNGIQNALASADLLANNVSIIGGKRLGASLTAFQSSRTLTIANNGTAQLITNTGAGVDANGWVLLINQTDTWCAIYVISGTAGTTQEVSDPNAKYTPTATTAASINVYWSAGNSRYEVENKLGHTIVLNVFEFMGG